MDTAAMNFYVPSRERAGRVATLEGMPEWARHRTQVVVDSDDPQVSEYLDEYDCIILPSNIKGIPALRQYIMANHATYREAPFMMFLDDDLRFVRRVDGKLRAATHDDVSDCFHLLEEWLRIGFLHVGISQQAGNNRVTAPFADCTRMMDAYAYNAREVHRMGCRWDRLPLMEDMDMTLQLLREGKPNRVTYEFGVNQAKGRNAPGGCSPYRTTERQSQAARGLAALHPGFVTVRTGVKSGSWEGLGEREDVEVAWKKAFRGRAQRGLL